jgi:branched-subunit amino acid transport protein
VILVGDRRLPAVVDRCLALIPAALLAALVVKDTFSTGQDLVLDARAVGLAVAVVAAWRRAPLIVVIVLAAASTALVRALA